MTNRVERLLWNSMLWVQTLYSHNEFSFHDDHLIVITLIFMLSHLTPKLKFAP